MENDSIRTGRQVSMPFGESPLVWRAPVLVVGSWSGRVPFRK